MRALFTRRLLSLFAAAVAVTVCQSAQAIPILQLYVEGGTYDNSSGEETWVVTNTGGAFRIWAIGNTAGPGGAGSILDVKLSVVYDSAFDDREDFGISITGSEINTGDYLGWVDNAPADPALGGATIVSDGSTPLLGDGTPLPKHGEYGAGKSWREFELGDFTETLDSIADFIGSFPTSPTIGGQINVYDVVVTGLLEGESVHFDLYNHYMSDSATKFVNAPFSHDGEGGGGDTPVDPESVPEPSSIVLLALGALGAVRMGRRRKQDCEVA